MKLICRFDSMVDSVVVELYEGELPRLIRRQGIDVMNNQNYPSIEEAVAAFQRMVHDEIELAAGLEPTAS